MIEVFRAPTTHSNLYGPHPYLVNHLPNPGNREVTHIYIHPSRFSFIHPFIQSLTSSKPHKRRERGEVPNASRIFHAYFFIRVSSFTYGMSTRVLRDLDPRGMFFIRYFLVVGYPWKWEHGCFRFRRGMTWPLPYPIWHLCLILEGWSNPKIPNKGSLSYFWNKMIPSHSHAHSCGWWW